MMIYLKNNNKSNLLICLLACIFFLNDIKSITYDQNLSKLTEFKNNYFDFRIYFCSGVFFKNKDKHENELTTIFQTFSEQIQSVDNIQISQKFMLNKILNCLNISQKFDTKTFYFKIKEFTQPGNFIFIYKKIDSVIYYEDYFPSFENSKIIFDKISEQENDLMLNIQKMNKHQSEIFSREFFKLYSIYEKPKLSLWDIIVYIWLNIGGLPKLIACLMLTSVVIGCRYHIYFNKI